MRMFMGGSISHIRTAHHGLSHDTLLLRNFGRRLQCPLGHALLGGAASRNWLRFDTLASQAQAAPARQAAIAEHS